MIKHIDLSTMGIKQPQIENNWTLDKNISFIVTVLESE